MLAGGLCQPGYEASSRRDIESLSELELSNCNDAYDLDKLLARTLGDCCGDYIWAVGATVSLGSAYSFATDFPGTAPLIGGGVIGSPHMATASAAGFSESIGHGLYMLTFPGGPGCVAACRDASVLHFMDLSQSENRIKNQSEIQSEIQEENQEENPGRNQRKNQNKNECMSQNFGPAESGLYLAKYLQRIGVKTFLVVTDGAGQGAKGSIILKTEGKQFRRNTL